MTGALGSTRRRRRRHPGLAPGRASGRAGRGRQLRRRVLARVGRGGVRARDPAAARAEPAPAAHGRPHRRGPAPRRGQLRRARDSTAPPACATPRTAGRSCCRRRRASSSATGCPTARRCAISACTGSRTSAGPSTSTSSCTRSSATTSRRCDRSTISRTTCRCSSRASSGANPSSQCCASSSARRACSRSPVPAAAGRPGSRSSSRRARSSASPTGPGWSSSRRSPTPSLVPSAVATAVGVREQQGRRALDVLVDHLASQTALVVLDNCEHLVDATAEVAERILLACPGVVVLATSREQLGVPGETAWRVPSLSFPERARIARIDTLEAVRGRAALRRARPQGPAELHASTTRRPRPSRRSATGSTASRSRSSSRPRAPAC